MFRAARPSPIVRTPATQVPAQAPVRVEPEPPVVLAAEPDVEVDVAPTAESEDVAEDIVDAAVEFSGPVPDLADWDLLAEEDAVPAAEEPAVSAHADPVPEFPVEPVSEGAEPSLLVLCRILTWISARSPFSPVPCRNRD